MAYPCYDGPNPINEERRLAIWKWAKENGIDAGVPIEKIGKMIDDHFFDGRARPEWITDILSGRHTPFKQLTKDAWQKQYYRRNIKREAAALSKRQAQGPVGKFLEMLDEIPRTVAVAYHFAVFPISHAGNLINRPSDWKIFVTGYLDAYHAAFSKDFSSRLEASVENDKMFPMAMQAELDAGPKSKPVGILSKMIVNSKAKWISKATAQEAAERSWKALTVLRYRLWKSQMETRLKPGMTPEEELDLAKHIAEWANNATGSGKGFIEHIPGSSILLFGPKLTQSKLNRMIFDPAKTISTFANWKSATVGEKAVAWTRLDGAAQYFLSRVGFLAANAGVLAAFNSKQKINYGVDDNGKLDPRMISRGDFLQFKGLGFEASIPGLDTEIKTLAKILAVSYISTRKDLRGQSRRTGIGDVSAQYAMNKASPTVDIGLEFLTRQNWRGQPLPFSSDKGTPRNPRLDWNQYLLSHAPIPLEGPVGYFYTKLKENGANATDAMMYVKGLIMFGVGFTGIHIQEEPEPTPAKR